LKTKEVVDRKSKLFLVLKSQRFVDKEKKDFVGRR
jgi:hypothetical protein